MKMKSVHVDALKSMAKKTKAGSKQWPTHDDITHKLETSDGRYSRVGHDEWWDQRGTDIVPQHVVDKHLHNNPRVGLVKTRRE